MDWIQTINAHMHEGACPTDGCIGECAAIFPDNNSSDCRWWIAALYIWDASFHDSARVAGWFFGLGAQDVVVEHVLFDSDNEVQDGSTVDGARNWYVRFSMPATAQAA